MIFPGAIIGGFSATGVTYDGTNDYLRKGTELTGLADGKVGTVSVWIKVDAAQEGTTFVLIQNGTDAADFRFRVQAAFTGFLQLDASDSGGTAAVTMREDTEYLLDNAWHHYLFAWNAASSAQCKVYVDGVDRTHITTVSDRTIDYTRGEWAVGGRYSDGFGKLDGDMAELWFDTTYLDIADAAVRAKFAKNGKPVSLGSNGSKPTGSAPMLYLRGGAANWGTNYAGTGDFTVVGAFADSSTKPSY